MSKRYTIALIAIALLTLLAFSPAVSAQVYKPYINQSATVFIGEEGLNIVNAMGGDTKIGWWASAADIHSTSPSQTVDVNGRLTTFQVTQSEFAGYTGVWYRLDAGGNVDGVAFTVTDPNLAIAIWDPNQGTNMNGKNIVAGQNLDFRIDTNMIFPETSDKRLDNANGNLPRADFEVVYTNVSGIVQFNDATTGGIPTNWSWTSGEGEASGLQNPVFNFADGTYTVTLVAANAAGTTTVSKVLEVRNGQPSVVSISAPPQQGYITIKVKTQDGATYSSLLDSNRMAHSLLNLVVVTQPDYWGHLWGTGVLNLNGQKAYPPGTYSIYAESDLNGMKDNYVSGSGTGYVTKTVSTTQSMTLGSDTLAITANKESVVRTRPFSVTVQGMPSTHYYLWLPGTQSLTGGTDNEAPYITPYQDGVTSDPINGPYTIGDHTYQNSGAQTIRGSVGNDVTYKGTRYYADIYTDSSGQRVVEFSTTQDTKDQKYTVRVESQAGLAGQIKTDQVDVRVVQGAMTIVAAGTGNYYLGTEIKLSGTNTESYETYMFIVGPNLPDYGANLNDPRTPVIDGDVASFEPAVADVGSDFAWSYKWGTAAVNLDAGTYTIYAVSAPHYRQNLANDVYATTSVIIKKPFVSATLSKATVAKGDDIKIVGTAEGQPPQGIAIWVLGKNYATRDTASVNADGSFTYEVKGADTEGLSSGQYFVVVQHPMQNGEFDVLPKPALNSVGGSWVYNMQLDAPTGMSIFKVSGSGSLQGTDAAEALITAISNPNVDDTYTKLQFLMSEPIVNIAPIGNKHPGDAFEITGDTNLAIDDEILIQVYSSSFKPTDKSQSGEFSGATGNVKVTRSNTSSGMNAFVFPISSSTSATFKPDEYIVTAQAIVQDATGSTLFNVLEGSATPTPTPTPTVNPNATAVPTPPPTQIPVLTAAPTPAPTVNATATTAKSPGFGAFIALIGLVGIAFIIVRREH